VQSPHVCSKLNCPFQSMLWRYFLELHVNHSKENVVSDTILRDHANWPPCVNQAYAPNPNSHCRLYPAAPPTRKLGASTDNVSPKAPLPVRKPIATQCSSTHAAALVQEWLCLQGSSFGLFSWMLGGHPELSHSPCPASPVGACQSIWLFNDEKRNR
jgi:hypothetical protein